MRKVRFLFLVAVVLAIAATPAAMGQDRNTGLDDMSQSKDHIASQPKPANTDQAKPSDKTTKEAKADDGHRKHWWSMPHRHKKQDKDANAKTAKNSNKKAVAAAQPNKKTSGQEVAANKNSAHPAQAKKETVKSAHASSVKTAHATAANKNTGVKKSGNKTVASAGHSNKTVAANKSPRKNVAAASHNKKTAQHDCSTEQAKKGGCQAVKAHGQKTTAKTTTTVS